MIWLVVFSGFLVCAAAGSTTCPIMMSPPRVVVRYGDSLLANCSATHEIEGIGWESTYGGTGLKTGVSSVSLKIDPVKAWVIEPQCYINEVSGEQCVENLPVTVYKTPESVTLSPSTNTWTPMNEGESYVLSCHVVDVAPAEDLRVCWYKGNYMVLIDDYKDRGPVPVNITSFYKFIVDRENNGMKIWCEATLKFNSIEPDPPAMPSKAHEMVVLYPPTFIKSSNETVELRSGKTLALNCTATGNPAPVYSWDFPALIQETIKKENVTEVVWTPTFLLPGEYSCTASNSHGESTKYFSVVEAAEDRTTFAAIVGVFASLGVLLLIAGPFFVASNGSFSFNKGSII